MILQDEMIKFRKSNYEQNEWKEDLGLIKKERKILHACFDRFDK